jgi:probable phosphoglycerate mutase
VFYQATPFGQRALPFYQSKGEADTRLFLLQVIAPKEEPSMFTILLIRHGENDYLNKALAGRLPGVHLNARGKRQAEELTCQISSFPIVAIFSSPLERAQETALPLSKALGIPIQADESLTEYGFGEWTGKSMTELESLPGWNDMKHWRSCTRPPAGEPIVETQQRIILALEKIQSLYPEGLVAAITHADNIRAALAFYLGFSVDLMSRLEISPCSISVLRLERNQPHILAINRTTLEEILEK